MDTEIRKVGAPIVLGTIPGIIAIVGCSNFPEDYNEVADIARNCQEEVYRGPQWMFCYGGGHEEGQGWQDNL